MRQNALWSAAAEDAVTHRLGTLVEMEVARKRADGYPPPHSRFPHIARPDGRVYILLHGHEGRNIWHRLQTMVMEVPEARAAGIDRTGTVHTGRNIRDDRTSS